MKTIYLFVARIVLFLLLPLSAQAQFKVIGYYPTWMNFPSGINNVDLAKVTHINIAFANPNSSGTLIPSDGVTNTQVTTFVTACHNKGVKVFLSIGGAGAPGNIYKNLLSNSTNINSFVAKIISYATTYNLDGIDVDIEGDVLDGSIVTATQYENFVTALATALHGQNKLMSAALATWFADYVTNTAASKFDWINLMSYDAYGPWSGPGPHSPLSLAKSDFQYWNTTKAVPSSQLVIGVPFYGYGWGTYYNSDEIGYCDIVNTYPGAENSDQVGSGSNMISYNGINTIKQKTTYAMQNASGVMIWEIAEDCSTSDSRSLLLAINQVVNSSTQNPTITFNNVTKTYGDASFAVDATSNSSGAITYSITSGSQYASITSGGQVTILGAGTVTIKATQAAATGYNAGSATATLTINKATLTATANDKSKVYNTANPTLTISYSGFKYSDNASAISTPPMASTTAVTNSNVGTYPITLTGGSAANYTLTLANGTLTVTQATPTLSYTGATSGTQGGTIALTATSNSTGAITYTVANGTGSASVSWNTLNLTSAGTVTLTVSVAATTNYAAASTTVTITINPPANPTITFNNVTKTYGDASFSVAATSNSSGGITYSITSGSQYASITSGGQVTILGAGTVTIKASQAAATGYNAGSATATLTINKANLTAKADNKSRVYNTANPTFTITYLGFVYSDNASSLTTQPAASTAATTTSNVGTYPITLTGGSSSNYNITLANGTLTIIQATPTLSYTGATSGTEGGSIALSATSNSTGAITYSVANGTGTASVSGTTLNLTSAGTVTLTINVAATNNYKASSVQASISIYSQNNVNPSITFGDITKTYGDAPFTVAANSNSSGAITYSITSGSQYATVTSNGTVSILGAGSVTLQANQEAVSGYNSATATATLTINKANLTVTADNKTKVYNTANPTLTFTYSGFKYTDNSLALGSQPTIATTATTNSNVGTYPVTLAGGSDDNYNFILVNGSLTITQATPTLTYTGATTGTHGSSLALTAESNSTGDITYSVTNGTGTASVSGTNLNLTSEGTVTVTVSVAATQNYSASSIEQEITITPGATAVNNSASLTSSFEVYPNPVSEIAQISIQLQEVTSGILELCDMNGKVLKVITEGILTNQNEYSISMNEYSSGLYILKLSTDKGMAIKKISK